MGPGAELVSAGAEMKRVDHPGAPGAEAVVSRGPALGTGRETVDDEAADGELVTGTWGSASASVGVAPQAPGLRLDARVFQRLTGRATARLRRGNGRRIEASRGRSVGAMPNRGTPRDIAWEATLRSVACGQAGRLHTGGLAIRVDVDDLLRRKRARPPDQLLMFVVDASGSMAGELTAVARSLAERAIERAYVDRQRVAMIAFRAHGAELLFGPTARVERVRRALEKLPLGGATPLGRGLDLAHKTLRRAATQNGMGHTTVVVISDGDANVGNRRGFRSAFLDAEQACRKLVTLPNTEFVLLDTTEPGKDDRYARWIVDLLGARHIRLRDA